MNPARKAGFFFAGNAVGKKRFPRGKIPGPPRYHRPDQRRVFQGGLLTTGARGGVFKSHLPPAIATHIVWETLERIPGSFVKSSLQQVHSDLLFSARIGDRETLLYLLFEHQSTPDPAMPLRLLGYLTEIFTRHHKTHGFPLPPVLPFVLHQGPEEWKISTRFEDLFELPQEVAGDLLPYLPKFSHALLDLTRFDPADQKNDLRLRAVLHLMKLVRTKDLHQYLKWLGISFNRDAHGKLLNLILIYAIHADGNLDVDKIHSTLGANPELEKAAMSVAEQLIARGKAEGLSKGACIGRIQSLEEFLSLPATPYGELMLLDLPDLEARKATLRREYEAKFKRP